MQINITQKGLKKRKINKCSKIFIGKKQRTKQDAADGMSRLIASKNNSIVVLSGLHLKLVAWFYY